MSRTPKPKVDSFGQRELNKAQENFERFDEEVKSMTLDKMSQAPVVESEPQTKLSSKEWKEAPEIYLKPNRTIDPGVHPKTGAMQKFNEKFRESYEFDKQYVRFIAENNEIIGETITMWTRPYGGLPAEEWLIPCNKPIWGPRYLAEQIKRKKYQRLRMEEKSSPDNLIGSDSSSSYYGKIVAESTIQRLDARSAPKSSVSFNKKVSNF